MPRPLDEMVMEYCILVPGPFGYPLDITPEDKERALDIWQEISKDYPLHLSLIAIDKARATLKLIDPSIQLLGESK